MNYNGSKPNRGRGGPDEPREDYFDDWNRPAERPMTEAERRAYYAERDAYYASRDAYYAQRDAYYARREAAPYPPEGEEYCDGEYDEYEDEEYDEEEYAEDYEDEPPRRQVKAKAARKTRAARRRTRRRRRRRRHPVRTIIVALILVGIALLLMGSPPVRNASGADRSSGRSNILLAGTDESGLRTDTIMLLSLERGSREIRLLSIPRDTYAPDYAVPKINSAYVAMGLLYGEGDFGKSMEIATRCGQDSDCNPATVGGVLGVMLGKSGIPAFWREPLDEIWDLDFEGTDVSLAKGSLYSYNQALQLIEKNGGKIGDTEVTIPTTPVKVLPLEQNFTNTYPIFRDQKDAWMDDKYEFDFSGNGFCIWGNLVCLRGISKGYADRVSKKHVGSEVFALAEEADPYVAEIEVWIDGELDQVSILPMKGTSRKLEPAWKYLLPEGRHHVKMVWRNPDPAQYLLRINAIQYYSEKPAPDSYYHN